MMHRHLRRAGVAVSIALVLIAFAAAWLR